MGTRCAIHAHRHAQHLVEVAIVDIALIIDADHGTAHQTFHIFLFEIVLQQRHVPGKCSLGNQRAAKALNRHVGQRIELSEGNAEMLRQFALVILLQLLLIRRQRRTQRVVD